MTTPTLPDASAPYRLDGLLIQFDPTSTAAEQSRALEVISGRFEGLLSDDGAGQTVSVGLGQGMTVERAMELLSHLPGVKFAEPDYILTTDSVSNDTAVASGATWGLYGDAGSPTSAYGSQATEAWAAGYTGTTKTAVGVIDTGVDYTHPDLYLNIWLNQREIPTALKASLKDVDSDGLITFRDLNNSVNSAYVADKNANGRIDAGDLLNDVRWENGIDEDANGYKDDLIGWDWKDNDNDPMDTAGHGTHVAGTIGAVGGNAAGVAGVNWSTQIVALRFMDATSGLTSAAAQAVDYFTKASQAGTGVDFAATNNSWGGGQFQQIMLDAIVRGAKQNILFVAAAGNGGSDSIGDNTDSTAYYPASYNTAAAAGYDAVIAVGSMSKSGTLSTFSNYGSKSVDLVAPGESIYSTYLGGGYQYMQGTSMATPHVAGAIALYSAYHSSATAAQIRTALLGSTVAMSSLTGKVATGGRLDIADFLGADAAPAPTPPPPTSSGGVTITGTAGADNISTLVTVSGQPVATVYGDTISGLGGNDTLNGGGGADSLAGGLGDDTYVVDNAGDLVVEASGSGNDLVQSSLSFTLAANVERLTLTGSAAINGAGNDLGNIITGNAAANSLSGGAGDDYLIGGYGNDTLVGGDGNDRLQGDAGADVMQGGAGNDTYYVENTGDVVTEAAGAGRDLVYTAVSHTLSANVEDLSLWGGSSINGTGNDLGNSLVGNSGANRLTGLGGNDTISAGAGNDTVVGGVGVDDLTGGAGYDCFIFAKGEANGDTIRDFALGDIIQLTGYSAGSSVIKVAGSLTDWVITDAASGLKETLHLMNGYALKSGDFLFG
jgi:subtilisin family serine protease